MANHNLDPIRKCVAPEDVHEVQRVLGLFVQHLARLKTWATDAAPLHRLTRKHTKWTWGKEENDAFETLRKQCLENMVLARPDYTKQFRVAGDASDDGKGLELYQLKDTSECDLLEADYDAGNRLIIAYYSKPWTNSIWRANQHTTKRPTN